MKLSAFIVVIGLGVFASTAASGFAVRGFVTANGGQSSVAATNGVHGLYGTVGQVGVGIGQNASQIVCSGFWCFGGSRVVAVEPRGGLEFALGAAVPNPTRDQARFALSLPKAANVTLTVYDVAGRQVGGVVSRELQAGEHELYWRAPGDGAGVYFMRFAIDGTFRAQRMIVLVR